MNLIGRARPRYARLPKVTTASERRVVLAGESPVRVSAGAPGSRLQPGGEIRPSRAECQKPLKERGANRRAATISERNSLVILPAERCLGGPSRSYHGEGNRQHPGSERVLDLLGVAGGGTLGKSNAEQERSYLAAKSGKDRAYKAGRLKAHGAGSVACSPCANATQCNTKQKNLLVLHRPCIIPELTLDRHANSVVATAPHRAATQVGRSRTSPVA